MRCLTVSQCNSRKRELKIETFSGRRQLQPDVTSSFVGYCACSCSPPSRRGPVGGVRQTQTADLQTCRPADLQTSRLADSKICRPTFFVTGLWANFVHPLFTVGESQSMSEANNSANGLQTQQCPIRQVTGNPCRGRLNIGRTVT